MASDVLKALGDLFGEDPATTKQRVETIDKLARRVRELEARAQKLRDLIGDPEQSHRMITRKEIGRILDGREDG